MKLHLMANNSLARFWKTEQEKITVPGHIFWKMYNGALAQGRPSSVWFTSLAHKYGIE